MARIYVATSWRNNEQPEIINTLTAEGHECYDFRNPPHREGGFHWSDIDPDWKNWDATTYRDHLLNSPIASHGYLSDLRGMEWADTGLLVMKCGNSAHLELGYMAGRGKRTIILLDDGEPDLMRLMADDICVDMDEVLLALRNSPY